MLCIGAGGLGSPAALYLAAAGVGTLGIVDFDTVDFSNLQRQILHGTPDVGRSKLASAKDKLNAHQPEREHRDCTRRALTSQNALELFAPYDVILDGTDNFPTRYLRERRLRAARQAERLRQHLPLRRAGVGVRDQGRPVLPLPVSRAAAARAGAELRRRRRARRAARHDRRRSRRPRRSS